MIVAQLGSYLIPGLLTLIAFLSLYHGVTGRPADKTNLPINLRARAVQIVIGAGAIIAIIGYARLAYGPAID